jgi:Tol biopolymer transport system component/DNA-binding winged helix-turn-helix (wHTH) protein
MDWNKTYEFGPFRLDVGGRQLFRDGQAVPITPKVCHTLCYLIENRERVLGKAELMEAIWGGRRVEEANLAQNISVLRKALGESADLKYIGTYPGRGYQFLAAVKEATSQPIPKPRRRRALWAVGAALGTLALAAPLWLSGRGSPAQPPPKPVPISRFPGSEFHPAISRDGASVAFAWDQENGDETAIYVRGPEDATPRRLSRAEGQHLSPAWSPDRRQVAYLRFRRDAAHIVIAPAAGGPERELAQLFPTRYGLGCRHLDWSPDGRSLAVDDKENDADAFGIYLLDVSTGRRKRLTQPPPSQLGDLDPRFSPDGTRISFVRMEYRFRHDLFVVPVAGGPVTAMTRNRRQIGGHDWTRDGRAALFTSDRTGEFRLYESGPGGAIRRSFALSSYYPIQIATARDTDRLVYAEFPQNLNVWRIDLPRNGGAPQWKPVLVSTATEALPQISPDGKRICFRSDRSGEDQLWVASVDGQNARQLTRSGTRPGFGSWSPDGQRIVYGVGNGEADYIIPADGGPATRVPGSGPWGPHPKFFPDGHSILISDAQVFRVELVSGNRAQVSRSAWGALHAPQWSRDGDSVYFVPSRTATAIWRGALASGEAGPVLDGLLPGYWGAWAVADEGIYYLGRNPGDADRPWVMRYEPKTRARKAVTRWPGPLPPMGASLWSLGAGGLYVVRVDRSESDVSVLDPFNRYSAAF